MAITGVAVSAARSTGADDDAGLAAPSTPPVAAEQPAPAAKAIGTATEISGIKIEFATQAIRLAVGKENPESLVIAGTPMETPEASKVSAALARAAARYPATVLASVIDKVEFFQPLTVNDRPTTGAHAARTLMLAGREILGFRFASEEDLERSFHNETASLLLERYPKLLDGAKFKGANPSIFNYADDIMPGSFPASGYAHLRFLPTRLSDLAEGFLSTLSNVSLEVDFAIYGEHLMWKPEVLLNTFAADSAVGKKTRVVRDFYLAFDPRFAAAFAPEAAPAAGR